MRETFITKISYEVMLFSTTFKKYVSRYALAIDAVGSMRLALNAEDARQTTLKMWSKWSGFVFSDRFNIFCVSLMRYWASINWRMLDGEANSGRTAWNSATGRVEVPCLTSCPTAVDLSVFRTCTTR